MKGEFDNRLSATRDYAAGVYDPQHGFVITGGSDGYDALSTAERTYDGVTFEAFPEMPGKMGGHCLVSLKNGNLLATGELSTFLFNGSNSGLVIFQLKNLNLEH